MAEYIEREALMRNLKQFAPEQLTPLIESLIQKQPAADVVYVVRCKDCLYAQEKYGHIECINGISYRNYWNKPDDFCSHGVRKVGNGK